MKVGKTCNEICGCLPKTSDKFDLIWVIFYRLTKFLHFISVMVTNNAEKLVKLYICEIVPLHGIPISIIFDKVI